jgi:hypothetical protein
VHHLANRVGAPIHHHERTCPPGPAANEEAQMSNLLNGVMADAKEVLLGAIIIMAIAFVIMTWIRTRSLVPTLGSLLLGAVVIAGVNNYGDLKDVAEKDITNYTTGNNGPVTVDD